MKLVGNSPELHRLKSEISSIAYSDAKVLITGPTGAGKELVAREIHAQSQRRDKPFIPVNCAALTETLLESELFGHLKGSYTGASGEGKGRLAEAHNGTLFLDEIGDMTPKMQGLILRFLESGEIQPVGSSRAKMVDVRVITATNVDLLAKMAEKAFRKDLYFRINAVEIKVPALVDHTLDIPKIIDHFLALTSNGNGNGHSPVLITPEALEALQRYDWPGNVRELKNVVERVLIKHKGERPEVIGLADLPIEIMVKGRIPTVPLSTKDTALSDELCKRMTEGGESFWSAVYPLYMKREISREHVLQIVESFLSRARGNYKVVTRRMNMPDSDYKKFLNFLRKHNCELPFHQFRH